MKKIFTLLVCMLFVSTAMFAQDKKMKFGLKIAPFLNSYKSDNEKDLTGAGSRFSFMWGGTAEINLGDNAAIVTGIDVAYTGGKIDYLDSVGYVIYDEEVVEINKDGTAKEPLDSAQMAQSSAYLLTNRSVKGNYINLPFHLKFKTNEINYLTYFGQIGLNTMINTNGSTDDEVNNLLNGGAASQTDLAIDKELQPVTFALHVQAGAEYNLSGSTSVVFGLFYNNGFSNVIKGNSSHLVNLEATGDGGAFEQKVVDRSFGISVGILF